MVPPSPSPDLTSIRRRLRVAAEVVAVVGLAALAWWCWHRGVIVTMRRGVAMSRIEGGWWAGATAAATLAGILLVDMVRR
jgi:hypothetical protein